ncbi:MAG: Protease HtpX-like protein, partial [Berkelbacteria bacterium GW2011_GWA2_35_9]
MNTYNQISSNKRKSALLIGVFLILLIAVGWGISGYYGNPIFLYIAVVISFTQAWVGYYYGDKIALATSKAIPITGKENREAKQLVNLVHNLSITAGMPTPKVYLINDSAPNAFATGRDPKHASIAVTTGLVEKLEDEEL